jgi:Na+/melibiose symporter-like transporter
MQSDRFAFFIGALLLWQLYATILVALNKHLDNEQKVRLIAITWALPLLGAIYARFALNQAERDAAAQQAREDAAAREKSAGA